MKAMSKWEDTDRVQSRIGSTRQTKKHINEHRKSLIGDNPVFLTSRIRENAESDEGNEGNEGHTTRLLTVLTQTMPGFVFIFLYPTYVIPLYRSQSTSDTLRLVLACFVHPILLELSTFTQRITRANICEDGEVLKDPKKEHLQLSVSQW